MTYFLLDRDGYVCDVGTTVGLEELINMVPALEKGELTDDDEKMALIEALERLNRQDDANKVRDAVMPLTVTDGVIDEGEIQADTASVENMS